ncbi:hypothetical protein P7K49_031594 [Saguinus oedipus]|uniref:Uncharacterized protein n=1 Tax=Saguinus oedipus TaxID=9490 RepID=A0ABQ9U107_SAGOE|nr:hypothetical protein P7K49_031594 [Saguinus oedipus]
MNTIWEAERGQLHGSPPGPLALQNPEPLPRLPCRLPGLPPPTLPVLDETAAGPGRLDAAPMGGGRCGPNTTEASRGLSRLCKRWGSAYPGWVEGLGWKG